MASCEIQIKTDTHSGGRVNYSTGDASLDESGVFVKGYPVDMLDDPKVHRGFKEGLPYFCYIKVTDASTSEVNAMIASTFSENRINQDWVRNIDFAVVNSDTTVDGWRLRAFTTNPGFSNKAGITQQMVESYLTKWNAEVYSATTNEVQFNVAIFEDEFQNPGAIQSRGFWSVDPVGVVFNEILYTEGTGEHIIEADYSATSFKPLAVERKVVERGGVVSMNSNGVITFTIYRTDVFQWFQYEVARSLADVIYIRQFRIPESTVDNIISNGTQILIDHYDEESVFRGTVEYRVLDVTLSQVESFLINRLDEDL